MTFQYPVTIARNLVTQASQLSQSSMEVHGIGLIEKLFDVACSLTDVLSLLPRNTTPFTVGPQDYLHQFMTLLSILRHGDHRFLPLLLSKVHDVLPTLTNPMLQTVPETAPPVCEVDIFEGFGPIMTNQISSNYMSNSMPNNSSRMTPGVEFKMETPGLHYDKRIEELSSPTEDNSSSFASPMEYPGLPHYGYHGGPNGHNLPSSNMSFVEGQPTLKREFDGGNHLVSIPPSNINVVIQSPVRQNSSNYNLPPQIPRGHEYLHRTSSGEMGMGMTQNHHPSHHPPHQNEFR